MPTDLVELCIAACCIASVAVVRSPALAARDGLDRKARAVALGMACTLMLIIANSTAYVLDAAVLPLVPLSPSTADTIAPLVVMVVSAITVAFVVTVSAGIHAALHQLLKSLMPAVAAITLLLAAVTALWAPAQNIFHAALTAVAAGFSFTLLLQLSNLLAARLDVTTREPGTPLTGALTYLSENSAISTLLLAGALSMLITAFSTMR